MQGQPVPEPAVAVGEDPRTYARLMSAVYDATMAGDRAPARPRQVIEDSWRRLMSRGIGPDEMRAPIVESAGLEALRGASGLLDVLDEIAHGLESLVAEGENILVVADASGRVLWRSGSNQVLSHADRLGFVEGAHWGETAVGTNAIGTALASKRAVQVFSAEHYLRSHHPWTCAGAPIRDPRTGQVIGVVDVSGPAATVHPTTVALVDAVARLAESHLREQHDRTLNRLRTVAAPILARIGSPALAVDQDGWVAAVDAMPLHNRILLPGNITDIAPGRVRLSALGPCDVEPLPGGWLVRLATDDSSGQLARVTLDLRNPDAPSLAMAGQFDCMATRHLATPRRDPPGVGDVIGGQVRHRTGSRPLRRSVAGRHGARRGLAAAQTVRGIACRAAVPVRGDGRTRCHIPRGHVHALAVVDGPVRPRRSREVA